MMIFAPTEMLILSSKMLIEFDHVIFGAPYTFAMLCQCNIGIISEENEPLVCKLPFFCNSGRRLQF